jgi:hypothetical protein
MIEVDEFVERLCKLGAGPGTRPFPRARGDREILIESIVMSFDSGQTYREREVNELLQRWSREVAPAIQTDHVTLRRTLVDYGRLERTADGRFYRVGFPQRMTAFDLAVYDLDLRAVVAAYRESVETRRKKSRAAAAASVSKPERPRRGRR